MMDWHCHLLPGVDDGPSTLEESVGMAKVLARAGYTSVYCTPHLIKGTFEESNDRVREVHAVLEAELARKGIDLQTFPGREYYLDEFLMEYLKDPLPLGDTQFLLIEVPNNVPEAVVKETCHRIKRSGYTPMVAHPERCKLFELAPPPKKGLSEWLRSKVDGGSSNRQSNSVIEYLMGLGCAFQGDLGSFAGQYGRTVREAAAQLHQAGVYTHFGSDLHNETRLQFVAGLEILSAD